MQQLSQKLCEQHEREADLKAELDQARHQRIQVPLNQAKDQASYAVFQQQQDMWQEQIRKADERCAKFRTEAQGLQ